MQNCNEIWRDLLVHPWLYCKEGGEHRADGSGYGRKTGKQTRDNRAWKCLFVFETNIGDSNKPLART